MGRFPQSYAFRNGKQLFFQVSGMYLKAVQLITQRFIISELFKIFYNLETYINLSKS